MYSYKKGQKYKSAQKKLLMIKKSQH